MERKKTVLKNLFKEDEAQENESISQKIDNDEKVRIRVEEINKKENFIDSLKTNDKENFFKAVEKKEPKDFSNAPNIDDKKKKFNIIKEDKKNKPKKESKKEAKIPKEKKEKSNSVALSKQNKEEKSNETNEIKMSAEEKDAFVGSITDSKLPDRAKEFLISGVVTDQFKSQDDFFEMLNMSNLSGDSLDNLIETMADYGIIRNDYYIEQSQTQDLRNEVKTTIKGLGHPDLFEQFQPNPKKPKPTPYD